VTQVKADESCSVVSAASIIAKVYRDILMQGSARLINHYAFEKNVGYATRLHKIAIKEFGLSSLHRKTFISTS
jgi:ribonuclease HII